MKFRADQHRWTDWLGTGLQATQATEHLVSVSIGIMV